MELEETETGHLFLVWNSREPSHQKPGRLMVSDKGSGGYTVNQSQSSQVPCLGLPGHRGEGETVASDIKRVVTRSQRDEPYTPPFPHQEGSKIPTSIHGIKKTKAWAPWPERPGEEERFWKINGYRICLGRWGVRQPHRLSCPSGYQKEHNGSVSAQAW